MSSTKQKRTQDRVNAAALAKSSERIEQVAARDLRRGDLLFERNEADEVRFREVFEVDFNPMTGLCAVRVGDRIQESLILTLAPGLYVTRKAWPHDH